MFSTFRAFFGRSDTPKGEVQHAERALDTLERLEALRGTAAVSGYVAGRYPRRCSPQTAPAAWIVHMK